MMKVTFLGLIKERKKKKERILEKLKGKDEKWKKKKKKKKKSQLFTLLVPTNLLQLHYLKKLKTSFQIYIGGMLILNIEECELR